LHAWDNDVSIEEVRWGRREKEKIEKWNSFEKDRRR
jgi:hypothetical protein